MSKTITIPSDRGSVVDLTINGVRYLYAAGATVTVPDEVAAALEDIEALKPVPGGYGTPLKAAGFALGSDSDLIPVYVKADGGLAILKKDVKAVAETVKELPEVSGDDDGKVLTVVDGAWAAAAAAEDAEQAET